MAACVLMLVAAAVLASCAVVGALPAAPAAAAAGTASGTASGAAALPASFDARSLVFGCADTIMDQGACGSCWAFSSVGVLTDRYCIWSGGRLFAHTSLDDSATLSPQPLLGCGPVGSGGPSRSFGCDGVAPEAAWQYLQQNGSLTCRREPTQVGASCNSGCAPYESGSCAAEDPHHPTGCSTW